MDNNYARHALCIAGRFWIDLFLFTDIKIIKITYNLYNKRLYYKCLINLFS